jgi:phage recombination protein Bet
MSKVIQHRVSQPATSDTGTQNAPVSDQKIQKETVLEYLKVFGFTKTLSEAEIQQFIQTALAGNLDPFKREIYIAVYGEGDYRKVSILTGYQVYLKRAERAGNLDGWRAWLEGEGSQMKAIVEIFRKDWSHSFTHEVYWEEAVQKKKDGHPTQFWAKQPRFQLRKVAIAQGFRLAFPDELGGLPYESAELPDTENTTDPVILDHDSKFVKASARGIGSDLAAQALETDPPPANPAPAKTETVKPPADKSQKAPPANTARQRDQRNADSEDDFLEKAVQQIEGIFEVHPGEFTEKHQAWILDKVYQSPDRTGIQKMLAYTEKVVKKAMAA